jgi:hypothetical protein
MSGAFEAAAGAFAVVGVADVLVRTGRELYSFLGDVADAPEEIGRLREVIQETLLLYQNSKSCQHRFATSRATAGAVAATASLESATKALNRELQALKIIAKKYKGVKTWRNFQFALGKTRLNKANQTLEQAKSLLTSSLTLACM